MPEKYYVGLWDDDHHKVTISPDGRLLMSNVPEEYEFYFHTVFDAPGVVAANTFISVLNPPASGKLVIFFQAEIATYVTGAAGGTASLVARRITAATGGTLITAAQTNRFVTTAPDPVAETRVDGPSITTDPAFPHGLNAWSPPQSTGAGLGGAFATATPPGEGFVCLPGQGLAFNTASGDIDQRWKINLIWAETDIS